MKVRVIKGDVEFDDVSVVHFPWNKKLASETESEFMDRMTSKHPNKKTEWEGKEFIDIDDVDLPSRNTRDKWYPDLINNGEPTVKVDTDWSIKLMKPEIIKGDCIKDMNIELDAELALEVPDAIKIAKLQRDKEKIQDEDDKTLYQRAIAGLDKRVDNGKADKPEIRAKLQAKIV